MLARVPVGVLEAPMYEAHWIEEPEEVEEGGAEVVLLLLGCPTLDDNI